MKYIAIGFSLFLTLAHAKEDCVKFDPQTLKVVKDEKAETAVSWKILARRGERGHWMTAHPSREEAEAALDVIKNYGYTKHCFVGRPDASMEYWK